MPVSSNTFSIATSAAFATRVSKIVSRRRMSLPPAIRPRTWVSYAARISSNVVGRNAGLLTSGEIDSVRFVGPIEPATNRGRSGVLCRPRVSGRARQARALEVDVVNHVLEVVVPLRDRGAAKRVGLDDVGACRQVLVMDCADHVRSRQDQDVAVSLEIARVIGEARPTEVRLAQLVSLNHRPHRAIEDQDAAIEK